ncbi:MAG: hypothetical protein M1383_02620 [Patescibacteria group bacterium]|nr:hypothetical protein [Patescibacteria group bacterium]
MPKSVAPGQVRAVVKRRDSGPKGPFAFCKADGFMRLITFSLNPPCWTEKTKPKRGDVVLISDFSETRHGWRAHKASFCC